MSKQKKAQSNQQTNTTKSKQLFTPLNQQEQQTIAGGWASRSSPSYGGSFW